MNEEGILTLQLTTPRDGQAGAQARNEDGQPIPAFYTNVEAEYTAVRGGTAAGVLDLSSRGRIELEGAEVVQFLNGMITNDVKALPVGAWMLAAFPNVQGRLIAFARVLRLGEAEFFLDTEAATRAPVLAALERFTLAGDFRVRDVTEETAHLSLQGAGAKKIVSTILSEEAAQVEREKVFAAEWQGAKLTVIRATHTGENGFDVFVNSVQASSLQQAFVDAGGVRVGSDAQETLRIEAGIPRHTADMDETNVVLETNLDEAVSYTKGCYIGQEIIARIHWRGHVARRLAGLSFDDANVQVAVGDKLQTVDGKDAGRVTSTTFSPVSNRFIALAYVRYAYLELNTKLKVQTANGEQTARVTPLPFVRGSWYEQN